ncbi:MAG: PAS domain-containing sensor histidine kinase [Pseudomonadota bacterium]
MTKVANRGEHTQDLDPGKGGKSRVETRSSSSKERFMLLPGWLLSNATVAIGLAVAAVTAFISTWFLLSPLVAQVDQSVLSGLVFVNIAIALGFAFLVSYRLWHVVSNRRHQLAGSRTHLQLVGVFALVAVVPAILAFLFAFTILRSSLNDVFGDRIDTYVNTALDLANTYFNDEAAEDFRNMTQIEFDLGQDAILGLTYESAPIAFKQRLRDQALGRSYSAILLMDANRQILSRVEIDQSAYRLPPQSVFDRIDNAFREEAQRPQWGDFGLNDVDRIDLFRGILKSEALEGGYIVIFRPVPQAVSERLVSVRAMRDDWRAVAEGRQRLERIFLLGYIVLAMIILFGAIWAALQAATRIVQPIGRLVQMASRVSSGDLEARVDVFKKDGELGALARAMNHMTGQLQTQRNDLIETNRQFDTRRRFTEAVLSGVSSGVVGIGSDGILTIANRSAEMWLGEPDSSLVGKRLTDVMPEIRDLLNDARESSHHEVGGQISLDRDGALRTFNVRIVGDTNRDGKSFVITFDDITELISAQRSAAWGDVARRIAHEIKNPLTPIQLSAERLRRKYKSEITTAPEIFDKCTETIIRHVADIGRMVDEFSSFARMPKPVIAPEDVRELVKSAVFTQRVAFPEIEFAVQMPDEPVIVDCDGRLFVQALGNIAKNACESIDTRLVDRPEPVGRVNIDLVMENGRALLRVMDNGIGLPKNERHRLTEPYMTTRAKGTGLGLAIVRKVIEDHEGALEFDDCALVGETGACVKISLPISTEQSAAFKTAAAE